MNIILLIFSNIYEMVFTFVSLIEWLKIRVLEIKLIAMSKSSSSWISFIGRFFFFASNSSADIFILDSSVIHPLSKSSGISSALMNADMSLYASDFHRHFTLMSSVSSMIIELIFLIHDNWITSRYRNRSWSSSNRQWIKDCSVILRRVSVS